MTAGLVESTETGPEAAPAFAVRLDNFEGPFDLLLSLISKHKLDITEVALSKVTDEFIGFIKLAGPDWDLEQTSSFLLVAATLLDLKAARLLPQGDVEDEEDLALLEARDLLFARLLQYRAFKQVASVLETRMAGEARRYPRGGRAGGPVRDAAPRGADRPRAGGVRRPRGQGDGAQAGLRRRPRAHPRAHRQRPRAGHRGGRPAAAAGHDDLPGALRRLAGHADHGGPVPGAAGAVPRGRGLLRPGHPAGRAHGPVDRRRGRGRGDHRRVRRRARGRAEEQPEQPEEPDESQASGEPSGSARTRRGTRCGSDGSAGEGQQ